MIIKKKVNAQNNEVIRNLKRENAEYQKNFSLIEGEHEKMRRKIIKLEELLKVRDITAGKSVLFYNQIFNTEIFHEKL